MPFDFLRRRKEPGGSDDGGDTSPVGSEAATGGGRVTFDALTEEWRLTGMMNVEGRLSDALNRRESISISDVQWAPVDGTAPLTPAPGLRTIDPYDLIAVLGGSDSEPAASDDRRAARRVRKDPYEVVIEAPPFRIVGTVHLFPGTAPQHMVDQAAEMFIPITNASAFVDERRVTSAGMDVILVNRLYIRGIEATGR